MIATLFHATNANAYQSMKLSGFMGMDISDYERLARKIEAFFVLRKDTFIKEIESIRNDSEAQGSVSFFKEKASLFKYGKGLASTHGEWKGLFIKRCIKKACRIKKIRYDSRLIDIIASEGGTKTFVILEVHVPLKYIDNKENLKGEESEIYSTGKIPFSCIKNVFYIL